MKQNEFILEENVPITMNRFQEVFDELMERTWEYDGNFYNLKELGWEWGYHSRKRSLGTASYHTDMESGTVEISKSLLKVNLGKNPQYFEDTIRHEIAHAIDYIIRGRSGHDEPWKRIARHLGAVAQSGTKKIEPVPKKWVGHCENGHRVTRHRLVRSARHGKCAKCLTSFKWEKQF